MILSRSAAVVCALALAGCMGAQDQDDGDRGDGGDGGVTTTPAVATTGTSAGDEADVELYDDMFRPNALGAAAGATLTFLNAGSKSHTVTVHRVGESVDPPRFDRELATGETVDVTFEAAGTYHVWCRFHGTMTGGMAMVVNAA